MVVVGGELEDVLDSEVVVEVLVSLLIAAESCCCLVLRMCFRIVDMRKRLSFLSSMCSSKKMRGNYFEKNQKKAKHE